MTTSAPRLDARLLALLEARAGGNETPAEIRRTLVARAGALGVPAPSYEHTCRLVALRRIELGQVREHAVLPVALRAAVGLEHGNEVLRVARGGRVRRT